MQPLSFKVPGCHSTLPSIVRLFFTTFPHPSPNPERLNEVAAAGLPKNPPLRARSRGAPPLIDDEDTRYYFFTIDDQLPYLSFFQDWGPLNLAMVYRACILIHELLEVCQITRFLHVSLIERLPG